MKLLFPLPNGEELDLLDPGPNGMEYVCQVYGEYNAGITDLLEDYKYEVNPQRRLKIADEIRDQADYFANQVGSFDEELQQLIGLSDLAERIYQCLITFAKI